MEPTGLPSAKPAASSPFSRTDNRHEAIRHIAIHIAASFAFAACSRKTSRAGSKRLAMRKHA
jgi:hypothetical protein